MIKYELKTVEVEMTARDLQKFDSPEAFFFEQSNQDAKLIEKFDNQEEAIKAFNNYQVAGITTGGCAVKYKVFEIVFIEMNEYDDDGEFICGGDWLNSKSSK